MADGKRLASSGIIVMHDTTSLIDTKFLEDSQNFLPEMDGSVALRTGLTPITTNAAAIDADKEKRWFYLDIAEIVISGQRFLLAVNNAGNIKAIFPDMLPEATNNKAVFDVYSYRYGTNQIMGTATFNGVGENASIPKKAKIINTNKFIYIVTTERSWVIYKNGRMLFDKTNRTLTIDALDATIYDYDTQSLKRHKVGEMGSLLEKGTVVYGRYRSEFGGRGRPTLSSNISDIASYVFNGVQGSCYNAELSASYGTWWQPSGFIGKYAINIHNSTTTDQIDTEIYGYSDNADTFDDYIYNLRNEHWKTELFAENINVGMMEEYDTGQITVRMLHDSDAYLDEEDVLIAESKATNYDEVQLDSSDENTIQFEEPTPGSPVFTDPPEDYGNILIPYITASTANEDYNLLSVLLWQREDGHCFVTVPDVDFNNGDGSTYNLFDMFSAAYSGTDGSVIAFRRIINEQSNLSDAALMKVVMPLGEADGSYFIKNAVGDFNFVTYYDSSATMATIYGEGVENSTITGTGDPDLKFYAFEVYCQKESRNNGELGGSLVLSVGFDETEAVILSGSWHPHKVQPIALGLINDGSAENSWKEHKKFAPVYMISKPADIKQSYGFDDYDLYSTHSTESNAPAATDQWSKKYLDSNNIQPKLTVDFYGKPYLTVHDLSIDNNELMAYVYNDSDYNETYRTSINCPRGFLEIYERSEKADRDILIGEQTTEVQTTYDGSDISFLLDMDENRYPVWIVARSLRSAFGSNVFTESIGDFDAIEYFAGGIWTSDGNILKMANMLLEHDPSDMIEVPSQVYGLRATTSLLFLFTQSGVYAMNTERQLSKLSEHLVVSSTSYNNTLFYATDNGHIYTIVFVPRMEESQYGKGIRTQSLSDLVSRRRIEWTVLDMEALENQLFVTTTRGVYVFDLQQQSWWRLEYDGMDIIQLIRYNNELYTIAGDFEKDDYETPYDSSGPS